MKKRIWAALIAPAFAIGMSACTVEQTEEGEMPDVDVQEGEMPEYDVDAADVDVNMDTTMIRTPDIDINDPDNDTIGTL